MAITGAPACAWCNEKIHRMGILERYQLILFHAPVLDLKAVSKVNRQELGGFLEHVQPRAARAGMVGIDLDRAPAFWSRPASEQIEADGCGE
ncbi:hypothetical protein M8818_007843 [Zalaria obscura]|uniref:Uncharacterized protein n=1 Tax=Zalaria obscura TaxID=2024903 RepID=A0ACC3S2S0_9PEZI